MTSKEQAERALRHHEESLFRDPTVHYASVQRVDSGPGKEDWLIEVGMTDPARWALGFDLRVPGADGGSSGDRVAIRLVQCSQVTTQTT